MQDDAPPPIICGEKAAVHDGMAHCCTGKVHSVGESLAGLFPAAGGAPHVAVLHPVHLAAFLSFATHLSTAEETMLRISNMLLLDQSLVTEA